MILSASDNTTCMVPGLSLTNKKSLRKGGLGATFRFFSYAQSLLSSGAKVKKETENSSFHTCVTLSLFIS